MKENCLVVEPYFPLPDVDLFLVKSYFDDNRYVALDTGQFVRLTLKIDDYYNLYTDVFVI